MTDPEALGSMSPADVTPAELAALTDQFAGLRRRKAELQKQVDEAASDADKIRKFLIAAMQEAGLNTVGGVIASVALRTKRVPKVENYDALYAHLRACGEFDLLYRRVNEAAVKERWNVGEQVPGVTSVEITDLSISTL